VVEEFLPGTEFVVTVWGRTGPDHVSIGEARFRNGLNLFTYAAKWVEESADYQNSLLRYDTGIEPGLRAAITDTVGAAWHAVGARGYLRVDLRLDAAGVPRVIDVNPNPEPSPDVGIHRAIEETGGSWVEFVRSQVEWA
jgi:D-alanine-D-alanine ligase